MSVITPGLLGPDYFREVSDVLKSTGPPDIARIVGVASHRGTFTKFWDLQTAWPVFSEASGENWHAVLQGLKSD